MFDSILIFFQNLSYPTKIVYAIVYIHTSTHAYTHMHIPTLSERRVLWLNAKCNALQICLEIVRARLYAIIMNARDVDTDYIVSKITKQIEDKFFISDI